MAYTNPSVSLRRVIGCSLAMGLVARLLAGCGSGGDNGTKAPGTGGHGQGGSAGGGGQGTGGDLISSSGSSMPMGPFSDFPATPILDMPAGGDAPPANAGDLFGAAGSGDPMGGPCLVEPTPGTLYPNNWLRPRFRFTPVGAQNLFEIRLKAPNETNELVVYTTAHEWKMPKAMWQGLLSHIQDVPITVTVRGAQVMGGMLVGKPAVGTSGDIRIAPVPAAGSIVYWRTVHATNTGELKGFTVGDESVVLALKTEQVQVKENGQSVTCLGCHASTPDGKFAAFKTLGQTVGGALASVVQGSTGQAPAFWSMASITAMSPADFGIPTFSKAHWKSGDYTLLTSMGNGQGAQLTWFDLQANASGEGVAFGYLKRTGDNSGAIMPTWSHDGQKIVYISTNGSTDGRPTDQDTDLYAVPYANRQGGAATPIPGASDPSFNEYYPALSPDDKYIAFNRIGKGVSTYNQPSAEVFVIPAAGGDPVRLDANAPAVCSGDKSPGVTNSWPKWAPEAQTVGDRTFYWLTFSSTRRGSSAVDGLPQLYVTAVVVQGGKITTYPALYLWNQPGDEPNHTPAWDVFDLPPEVN